MNRVNPLLVRGTFVAVVAAALGFGAAQAVAAPLPAAAVCYPEGCLNTCDSKGFASGYCSGGACYCVRF